MTPEQLGISSAAIHTYLELLERAELSVHSIVLLRGRETVFEKYYPPFHPDFLHREYSDTKSLVALAVGFAEQDGLVNLDDPIAKYFPRECENLKDPAMGQQTVKHMLTMSTPKQGFHWFDRRSEDRVLDYFRHTTTAAPIGSGFDYDSQGSFILGAMVERLTGKLFMDYLREKLFDKIGVSQEAHCLKAPGGHSWGDSAALMKPRDMAKIIRFLLDRGRVGGEQVLNERYIADALAKHTDTSVERTTYAALGYGYQIWRTHSDSFFFNGMGGQYAVGVPGKDLIFVINCDNQGIPNAGSIVMDNFFRLIADPTGDPLPEAPAALAALEAYAAKLVLASEKGEAHASMETEIQGKTYVFGENPLDWRELTFHFCENRGILEYTNAQGAKTLPFGLCENCFTLFPEEGYSRAVGSVYTPGNYYKCAASAAWKSACSLRLNVQVIDEYFGRLWMYFTFDGDTVFVKAVKTAEDFFTTYQGEAMGKLNEK